MIQDYDIADVVPYINWVYFYSAWQVRQSDEQQRLRLEAEQWLAGQQGCYRCHVLFRLLDVRSEDDDIIVDNAGMPVRIPCLRQQQQDSDFLCLADFIAPGGGDKLGLFVASTDRGMETDFDSDPYQKMLAQLLADRLAEAATECFHEQVRKQLWGYAPDEQLTIGEMHQEHFQGIRPAVGYPSLPDASLNFVLDSILGFSQIGVTLTENGAMRPHASVSGLMMAHPQARYFSVGTIGADQLHDYARRRGLPENTVRKFLSANL